MNDVKLDTLKNAVDRINAGEDINKVNADLSYVNYNKTLIKKIEVLKKITLLNQDTLKYLYSIELTDKIKDVEPKVNAIYQLAKNAGFIDDEMAQSQEEKKDDVIVQDDTIQTAINIANKIISGVE